MLHRHKNTYLTDKQHMLEPQFCIDISTNHCESVRLSYLVMVVYCNPCPFLYNESINVDAFLLIAYLLETDPMIYGFKICIVHSRVTGTLSRSWNFIHQNFQAPIYRRDVEISISLSLEV